MHWSDEKREVVKAFAIAPAIPIGIASLLALPAGIFVFIIGAPVAYACAAIIGVPLYLILDKFRIFGWPYFTLGGALCATPGVLLFTKYNVPIVYSLQSISSLTLIGAVGGFAFWWLYPRKKFKKSSVTNLPGIFLLVVIGGFLTYVYILGEYTYIEGRTLSVKHPFVSQSDTVVTIEANGQIVKARIPKGVPYRTNCKIGVVVWRELLSHKKVYSLSHYSDYPQAHHYQWLTEDFKKAISKSCS